ncbi:VOC family protein [Pedobacter jeongneungensis]|uniref:VOC family protein n=1 Tax=Pedobacter jeongneungensis TaxID=947309 RepID=UPI000469B6ED|nr:VOC family protein [Pedobacter jeongneungensis]
MKITAIDHIVLTVADIEKTVSFYTQILGFEKITFGDNRVALRFGNQKINLHRAGNEIDPKALLPTPGSADICLLASQDLQEIKQELESMDIDILEGIVERTGALGGILSIYIRDPDGNLIEISNYQ